MKLLLDTHAFLWALSDPDRLQPNTRHILADKATTVFVSVVSLWEIAVKCRVGKLAADIASITAQLAPASKIQLLDLLPPHLHALSVLPFHEQHRDPFDHLIIAQEVVEGMTLVTQDMNAPLYPVSLLAP